MGRPKWLGIRPICWFGCGIGRRGELWLLGWIAPSACPGFMPRGMREGLISRAFCATWLPRKRFSRWLRH